MKVYASGTFDCFHSGHVDYLRWCRWFAGSTSGLVVVGLNTGPFIRAYKGRPPVQPYDERRRVLEGCRYVDGVVENIGGANSGLTIDAVGGVNLIVAGSDWAPPRDFLAQMGIDDEWLVRRQIALAFIPRDGRSSTELKNRIRG